MSDHGHHHPSPPSPKPDEPKPTMGTHGMVLLGERATFLSHLPMFMFDEADHPHNFQVVLHVELGPPPTNRPPADLFGDRRSHPGSHFYTFVPDDFEMDSLHPDHAAMTSLIGEVHRGHFERHKQDAGEAIGHATANILGTILFRPFQRGTNKSRDLEYVFFGKESELFLAHVITSPPDFDQLLSVGSVEPSVDPDQLLSGLIVTVRGRSNTATTRLRPADRVAFEVADSKSGVDAVRGELQVEDEVYFEEGELGTTFTTEPTPEEKKAGF